MAAWLMLPRMSLKGIYVCYVKQKLHGRQQARPGHVPHCARLSATRATSRHCHHSNQTTTIFWHSSCFISIPLWRQFPSISMLTQKLNLQQPEIKAPRKTTRTPTEDDVEVCMQWHNIYVKLKHHIQFKYIKWDAPLKKGKYIANYQNIQKIIARQSTCSYTINFAGLYFPQTKCKIDPTEL